MLYQMCHEIRIMDVWICGQTLCARKKNVHCKSIPARIWNIWAGYCIIINIWGFLRNSIEACEFCSSNLPYSDMSWHDILISHSILAPYVIKLGPLNLNQGPQWWCQSSFDDANHHLMMPWQQAVMSLERKHKIMKMMWISLAQTFGAKTKEINGTINECKHLQMYLTNWFKLNSVAPLNPVVQAFVNRQPRANPSASRRIHNSVSILLVIRWEASLNVLHMDQ